MGDRLQGLTGAITFIGKLICHGGSQVQIGRCGPCARPRAMIWFITHDGIATVADLIRDMLTQPR
ncbi:hypothetical protein BGV48_08545 [Burkholderia ubonensis]|nr:hypothetical protein BGV48_08545 [Burkholderia ubonensis]